VARRHIAEGLPAGPFRGVPFLLKDLGAEARDFPSHNGSRLLRNTRYARDSAIYERLRATGLVTFGRTTAPEGGIGPATEAAVYGGPTRNPWDLARTPGGSSGGSAAAVAAGIVPAAHGGDGGGSVRIPASSCGLFGFKATRARFPDGPYIGEGWAGMVVDGFLTRSVRDAAALMDACEGADLGAPYWAPPLAEGYVAAIRRKPVRMRVALCTTTFAGAPVDPECREAAKTAAAVLEDLGHGVEEARPKADHEGMMRAWTKIVACGAALSVRKALAGRELKPDDVEGVTRGAIAYAEGISGADYLEAVAKIHAYGRELAAFFESYDILLSPTLAEPPAEVGRFSHATEDFVGFRMGPGMVFAYSPFCAPFNASGQPAASLPLHWTPEGLPVGVQLAARFGADEALIALCREFEVARPWFDRRPPLAF
jgi:amidase/6-aminohexanoate-cyclic-dimer hydrolase